jgi:hypothetical protein
MASVLWDARGNIFIDYFKKGQTVNSEYNMHLNDEIKKKRPIRRRKKCCFIKRMHRVTNQLKLYEFVYELLFHSPFYPDLAVSDFFLFADLKKMLAGNKAFSESYYKNGIEKLYDRYNRCIAPLERILQNQRFY